LQKEESDVYLGLTFKDKYFCPYSGRTTTNIRGEDYH